MDKKIFPLYLGVVVLVIASILICFENMAFAEECQIIKIEKAGGGVGTELNLIPESITVPVGTCTVWVNIARDMDIRVSFREGTKPCMEGTQGESGFGLIKLENGEQCYISHSLLAGKSASLVWTKPGIYKYTIEATSGNDLMKQFVPSDFIKASGAIIVK